MDAVGQLRATFRAAQEFGLSDEEIWSTVIEICDRVPGGAAVEGSFDELVAALAGGTLKANRPEQSVSATTVCLTELQSAAD
jgi:hypothetical protein